MPLFPYALHLVEYILCHSSPTLYGIYFMPLFPYALYLVEYILRRSSPTLYI